MSPVRASLLAACLCSVLVGCDPGRARLNAPPQGFSERQHYLQEPFVYMTDNAMLEDMTFSDVHFVPHTDRLNGLGARRLQRYADLLKYYGGTLYYDTDLDGADPLLQNRVTHAQEYLQLAGLAQDKFDIEVDGPAGRGIRAVEGVQILHAAEAPPKESDGGSGFGGSFASQ